MNVKIIKSTVLLVSGFVSGIAISHLPSATAVTASAVDVSKKEFLVSIDEISKNFVFGETFAGSYKREVSMSDGSVRTVELTPMIRDGRQVVEFKDTGGVTYMGLNGTTTNGSLMVQLRDIEKMKSLLAEEGWSD